MNKYANASSVHGAGRIKKKKKGGGTYTNLTIIFIILLPFSPLWLWWPLHHFLSMLSDDCTHNRLNRLMHRTEEKKKTRQIGWSFDG